MVRIAHLVLRFHQLRLQLGVQGLDGGMVGARAGRLQVCEQRHEFPESLLAGAGRTGQGFEARGPGEAVLAALGLRGRGDKPPSSGLAGLAARDPRGLPLLSLRRLAAGLGSFGADATDPNVRAGSGLAPLAPPMQFPMPASPRVSWRCSLPGGAAAAGARAKQHKAMRMATSRLRALASPTPRARCPRPPPAVRHLGKCGLRVLLVCIRSAPDSHRPGSQVHLVRNLRCTRAFSSRLTQRNSFESTA